eukprot:TRINITY_DN19870_c0_g1_i1.p1 TRINITY_DN19870_c0_g1~~TRINITY_DN19870_c0_g1_i1.p1  ORF type:complete len:580 (+),score=164.77 TRINITY_DN19870_c0_g1_i1:156-1895(+)
MCIRDRSQKLHHLTPLCLPDDRLLDLFRECNVPVEIVDTGRKLAGFKLWVVEEWLFSSTRNQTWVVQQSSSEEDVVEVDIVKISASATQEQHQFVWSLFGECAISGGWLHETEHGAIPVVGPSITIPRNLTMAVVPDGNLRAHHKQLQLQMSLKQMSCGIPVLTPGDVSGGSLVVFRSLYGARAEEDPEVAVSSLLNEIEGLLGLLGFLPWSAGPDTERARTDVRFSDVLAAALRGFQVECNTTVRENKVCHDQAVREDGHLDPSTLSALRRRYAECEARLREMRGVALNFLPHPENLTQAEALAVQQELSRFQLTHQLPRNTGSFDYDTLVALGLDPRPGDREPSLSEAASLAHKSHREDIFGESTLCTTRLADHGLVTEANKDELDAFPKGWTNHASPEQDHTPARARKPTPMQRMDESTPLSPRTRLKIGISDDPNDSVVSSTPNELFGSKMSPCLSSPDLHLQRRSLAFGEMDVSPSSRAVVTDQIRVLQAELEEQRVRADQAVAQAAQADAEREALRAAIRKMETQISALNRGPSQAGDASGGVSAEVEAAHPGMMILDVLGVLWLRDMVMGKQ